MPDTDFTTLQRLIYPDRRICTERELYVKLAGPAGLSESRGEIEFDAGGEAGYDTAFNLFNSGKWRRHCGLEDLHLQLEGEGRFAVSVTLALEERSWERLVSEVVTLEPDAPTRLDLSHFAGHDEVGVIFFELTALTPGRLAGAAWLTRQPPRRRPGLTLAITTFRREAAVRNSVRRFEDFVARSPLADHLHLVVVDNGKSAGIAASSHVTPIENENLGGSGGFARGLLEARRRGASHCLFMDDDASVHMESLERTWAMLAHAADPATAIAGGITIAAHRWALWENGAVFSSNCKPRFLGLDLREQDQVFGMEYETTRPPPPNHYGGWWFFAFPVEHATYMPFPFFVRGDDVSFGLAHDFNILTLPGVLTFQDEDFSDKESAQSLYLDLRSHMAHHLSLPHMDIGRWRTLRIPLWFFARNLIPMHYETLAALNLAFEDVLRGPDFFAENADMAQRRADIRALVRDEAWGPPEGGAPPGRRRLNPHRWLVRALMKITLNGHLLPFFSRFGNRITLSPQDRGNFRAAWGAARITYEDRRRDKAYTVTHSKRRALREGLRMIRTARRFLRAYPALRRDWEEGYVRLASEEFWTARLGLDPASVPAPAKAAPDPGAPSRKEATT